MMTRKQRLMLVTQRWQLEACHPHRPRCCGAEVGDDGHDGVLQNGDEMLFLTRDGDDGVV